MAGSRVNGPKFGTQEYVQGHYGFQMSKLIVAFSKWLVATFLLGINRTCSYMYLPSHQAERQGPWESRPLGPLLLIVKM